MEIKKYRHDAGYSYTLGMALTIELIKQRRSSIIKIFIHPDYQARNDEYDVYALCASHNIPFETSRKIFNRLTTKDNIYVIGVFSKYSTPLAMNTPHVVLVHPGESGNLGTIVRTGTGFGFRDFIIIRPGADIFDPRTIRASMGALFHCRFAEYSDFEQYLQLFPEHKLFPFMLNGKTCLGDIAGRPECPFTLVFGNEASGLPDVFHTYGESIYIRHNNAIDSLNLAVAFGIAANVFSE